MNRPNGHDRFEELAAGYALHALEPEEEHDFLSHLGSCARCERAVAVHDETLAHLAYATDDMEPPAALFAGIRAGVLASGREASFPDATPVPAGPSAPQSEAEQSGQPALATLECARRRRDDKRMRRAGTWMGVAAAAALVLGLGAWNASLLQDRNEQDAWGDRISAAVGELQQPGTSTVPLAGTDGDVVAVALVRGSELSLVVDGLPINDDSTTYVLWGQSRYGDVRAVGAFDVDRAGVDVQDHMQMQAGVADVTRFVVTKERGDTAPPLAQEPVLASGDL